MPTQLEELTVHVAVGTEEPGAYALTVIAPWSFARNSTLTAGAGTSFSKPFEEMFA